MAKRNWPVTADCGANEGDEYWVCCCGDPQNIKLVTDVERHVAVCGWCRKPRREKV
jgi:hypothetical protein